MAETTSSRKVGLEVAPVAGRIGAEIKGARLSPDLGPDTFNAFYQALHKVNFLGGNNIWTPQQKEAIWP